jgi:hypothetical protein
MMDIERRINAFVRLGGLAKMFANPAEAKRDDELYDRFSEKMEAAIRLSFFQNGWFTETNIRSAFDGIAAYLDEQSLREWTQRYPGLKKEGSPKRVGVIMAGNIPMVGFHDMLCVLLSGNIFLGKLSSDDKLLLPLLAEILVAIEPGFRDRVIFTEGKLAAIDAVIATGSNNSSRYFDYYFGKYPHIIRRNRNSIAVLDGTEMDEELELLGKDIFQYFGLGCRNISKLFIPQDFDLDRLFKAIYSYKHLVDNKKYGNNYDYNKTIYLLNGEKGLLENGFVVLKEDKNISSPVATIFYERYTDEASLLERLKADASAIQCIVSKRNDINNAVGFGMTQCPAPWDYADGVDTMKFLLSI